MPTPQPAQTSDIDLSDRLEIDIPNWLHVFASSEYAVVRRSILMRRTDPTMKPVNDFIEAKHLVEVSETEEHDDQMYFAVAVTNEFSHQRLKSA